MGKAKLSADKKMEFFISGRRVGTDKVLAQAERVALGWGAHGAKLSRSGFLQEDMDAMMVHVEDQRARYAEREDTQADKKVSRRGARADEREAKASRRELADCGRAVLGAMRTADKDEATQAAVARLELAVQAATGSSDDITKLRDRLRGLIVALDQPELAVEVALRAAEALVDARPRLVALEEGIRALAQQRGASELTEALDLVDGILMQYARDARRAARQAARRLGEPAVADAFALVYI